MNLEVKLEAFSGPLDLLLHLIDKNKVDILDIPIAEIAEQYMEVIRSSTGQDLDFMSRFLVLGATLLNLKARMLLPREKNEEGEEIDPREELVQKLIRYRIFKERASILKEVSEGAKPPFIRRQNYPKEVLSYRPPIDMDALWGKVDKSKLRDTYRFVCTRQVNRRDPVRSSFGTIQREKVKLSDVMIQVFEEMGRLQVIPLKEYLRKKPGKEWVIVVFLSVLELVKVGVLHLIPSEDGGDLLSITEKHKDGFSAEEMMNYD